MWSTIVALSCVCVAWVGGRPTGEDPIVLLVGADAGQSLSIVNPEQQTNLLPVEIPDDNNVQYFVRDFTRDNYQFGYNTGKNVVVDADGEEAPGAEMFRHEVRREDGTVVGRYGYVDPEGVQQITNYLVDENGFQLLEPGQVVGLDVVESEVVEEETLADDSEDNNKARSDLEEVVSLPLPAVPAGATDIGNGDNTYGYIYSLAK